MVNILETPLEDADIDALSNYLAKLPSTRAMNMETLDGFFAALTCAPEAIAPSAYLSEVWGIDSDDRAPFDGHTDIESFMQLIARHWNNIQSTLKSGHLYFPVLFQNEDGIVYANDWAQGFARGIKLGGNAWDALLNDEKHSGAVIPIFALAHEHDPDPAMRLFPEPIDHDKREQLLALMISSITAIYRYFEPLRVTAVDNTSTPQKIGPYDLCPCGSGKRHMLCCGGPQSPSH